MTTLVEECVTYLKFLEKAAHLLNHSTPSDVIERWKKHYKLARKTLRKVLNNKSLTVSQKQSVLHLTARVECIYVKVEALVRRGGSLTQGSIKRVQWIDLDSAFENRMRTSIIANIEHIDLSAFLDDASVLFARRVKRI